MVVPEDRTAEELLRETPEEERATLVTPEERRVGVPLPVSEEPLLRRVTEPLEAERDTAVPRDAPPRETKLRELMDASR